MVVTLSLLVLLATGEAETGVSPVAPPAAVAPVPVAAVPAASAPVAPGPGLHVAPGPPPPPLDASASHPPDPFAAEYSPPEESELGTAAGQLRFFAVGGLTGSGPDLAGALSAELMHYSFLGFRGSAALDISHRTDGPHLASLRLGAALHLLPFRRVDLTAFLDAGAAAADLFGSERRFAPALAPGAAFELSVTDHLVARAEGQALWAVLPETGTVLRPSALLGLGWVL